jgi:exonuclease VII small subunit
MKEKNSKNLSDNLKRLSEITKWFEDQRDIDVEEGLKKVKEAVSLIKTAKERLKEVENEFEEIKREVNIEESEEE